MAESYARIALRCLAVDGDPYQTSFAVRLGNELADVSLSDVVDTVDTKLTTAFRALLASVETFADIHAVTLPAGGVVPEAFTKSKSLAGTRTASNQSEPKGVCPVLGLTSSAATRSGRGWMFLPNLIDSATVSAGLIATGTFYTAIATFGDLLKAQDWVTAGSLSSVHPCVYSRTRRLAGEIPFTFDVTGYTRRQKPHWLRSRSLLTQR